jgi:hypothetical protein
MPTAPSPGGNKNWLLLKFRQWHSWGGLALSLFILVVAATGILLNHKETFLNRGEPKKAPTGRLTASTDLAALPVSFARALELAHGHFGDVHLEKIELKDERGTLVYKVARGEGEEIRVDARTGAVSSKYGLSLDPGRPGSINWAKVVDDLHTGKLFGQPGRLAVDLTAGTIIALTLTGIYLWAVPHLRKRQGAHRRREAATRPTPVACGSESENAASRLMARLAASHSPAQAAGRAPTVVEGTGTRHSVGTPRLLLPSGQDSEVGIRSQVTDSRTGLGPPACSSTPAASACTPSSLA